MASWLTGIAEIAGKAEDFLNKVDNTAAAVVSGNESESTSSTSTLRVANVSSFEGGHSDEVVKESTLTEPTHNDNASQISSTDSIVEHVVNDPPSSASSSSYAMVSSNDQQPSSSQMSSAEASALRGEVQLLSQELQSVTARERRAQRELREAESKLRVNSEQMRVFEKKIRDLEAVEQDQLEVIRVRDTQLEAAKNQIEEARMGVGNEAAQLAASDGIVVQRLRDEMQRLQSRNGDLEEEIAAEKRKLRDAEMELVQAKSEAESEKEASQSKVAELERRLAQQKTAASEASSQLRHWQDEVDKAKNELSEYKEKASRVLQSKERLIASLQDTQPGSPTAGASSSIHQLNAELGEVSAERDWLSDELQAARVTIETLRSEQRELERQIEANTDAANERSEALTEQIQAEKRQRLAAVAEVDRWRHSSETAETQTARLRQDYDMRLADRDAELERLRSTVSNKGGVVTSTAAVGDAELVARIQALTESLVQKQLVVETLTAEKNSIAAQLSRVERQFRELTNEASSSVVAIDDVGTRYRSGAGRNDQTVHQVPLRESAFDSPATRSAKRVVNHLDRFAGNVGVVLRRFPLARPFLLIYVAIIHVWVTFVLLTYEPEQHHFDTTSHVQPPMPVDSHQTG